MLLASAYRRSENVGILAVIIAELERGNIERKVFFTDGLLPDDPERCAARRKHFPSLLAEALPQLRSRRP
jgi:hypothetical protein